VRSWRTALRIARREARRAKGRAILVAAMIALPIAAFAFGAVMYNTFQLTPDERADRVMGSAQAAVDWPFEVPIAQDPGQLFGIPMGPPVSAARPDAAPTADRLQALLPAGTRLMAVQSGGLTVHTATGTGTIRAQMIDYADPLARGMYRQLSGRAPATVDEVALTPAAARRLDATVGGTARLADGTRTFRVVGIVEDPGTLDATTIVLHPGALPAETLSTSRSDLRWLVNTPAPLTWAQVKQLNTHGVAALSRYVLHHPPPAAEWYPQFGPGGPDASFAAAALVGGLAMLEIVLLAGPAFAVGARRRRRDLALVAAAGGTPKHVRRIVLADGVVLGSIAAIVGVLVGIVVAAGGRRIIEEHLANARSGAFRVFPLALVSLAGLAVLTGVLAALVPAWIAARQDVVAALAGRRGITRSRRRWVVVGAAMVAVGAGIAVFGAQRVSAPIILVGLVVLELGLVLCTPAIVGLVTRLARWLPLAPRIALRDTSRNRTAAAPAISAVMAAVIGSLAVGVVLAAAGERDRLAYRSLDRPGDVSVFNVGKIGRGPGGEAPTPQAIAAVRGTLPIAELYEIDMPRCGTEVCAVRLVPPEGKECPYDANPNNPPSTADQRRALRDPRCDGVGQGYIYFGGAVQTRTLALTLVVDPAAVGALTHLSTSDVQLAVAALRAGKVVADNPKYVVDGRVRLNTARPGDPRGTVNITTAPGYALPHPTGAPIAMMTKETAASLGMSAEPFVLYATTTRMPTQAEQDRLQAALGSAYEVMVERGPVSVSLTLTVLAIIAAVITLGAAAIATGLAAADGRADLATLAAVGAAPRVRRALALSQSGVIAGLGSLLGAIAGLGASVAVLYALNQRFKDVWPVPTPFPIRMPWMNVGVALVVVPLVAMLGAGLLTRSRLPIERRL
jgi:putative ABC transport system permease protein